MSATSPQVPPSPRVVAALDCGTNTLRLLIARVEPGGEQVQVRPVLRTMQVVRLGQDVDRTGRLNPHAIERALTVCQQFARICTEHGVQAAAMVATSALRDAANSQDFLRPARHILGFEPVIITGAHEARLSFAGASMVVEHPQWSRQYSGVAHSSGLVAVLDIGGGSTEVVLGTPGHQELQLCVASMDVGAVRLTERYFHNDPPTGAQVRQARQATAAALTQAVSEVTFPGVPHSGVPHLVGRNPLSQAKCAIGVAGTITTVAAHVLGLSHYDPVAIDGACLSAQQVSDACQEYLHMEVQERLAQPYLDAGRSDVIAAGVVILDEVMRTAGWAGLIVSQRDILDGVALAVATGQTLHDEPA